MKNCGIIHTIALFFFFLSCAFTRAQESPNRADKYVDAYKKYLNANCPIPSDSIQHFVYFIKNRELIVDHPFLLHPAFKGAQIMYAWKDFENEKDLYDFSILKED